MATIAYNQLKEIGWSSIANMQEGDVLVIPDISDSAEFRAMGDGKLLATYNYGQMAALIHLEF